MSGRVALDIWGANRGADRGALPDSGRDGCPLSDRGPVVVKLSVAQAQMNPRAPAPVWDK